MRGAPARVVGDNQWLRLKSISLYTIHCSQVATE